MGDQDPNVNPGAILGQALACLRAGLSVIPIRRDGTKAPAVKAWKKYEAELPTAEEASQWWTWTNRRQPPGIAIIGGAVSGGLECLDFDVQAETVYPAWCKLVEAEDPGLVGRLSIVRTPYGGYHVRYRCAEVPIDGNMKLAEDPEGEQRGGKTCTVLIETRGEGGYALAPGCPPECHETGRQYEHIAGPDLCHLETITAEQRETLLTCARSFDRVQGQSEPVNRQEAGLKPGEDFDRNGPSWAEILEPFGWAKAGTNGNEQRWRRPGKKIGWSATTGHCHGPNGEDLLRVFSSNAAPFEEGKSYGKFRAIILLKHGGDLAAAVRELRACGYGGMAPQRSPRLPAPARQSAPSSNGAHPHEHNGQHQEQTQQAEPAKRTGYRFAPLTSLEFSRAEYPRVFLAEKILVAGQPCIIGGPRKSLKTSTLVELAISLSTGRPVFDYFQVPRPVKTALLSGESGEATLQETARRVCAAKSIELENAGVLWGFHLPQLASVEDLGELSRGLKEYGVEAVCIDPLYLCLLTGQTELQASNLFQVGPLLLAVSRACLDVGCTPILAHHFKLGRTDPYGEPQLDDLAYAGIQEFARQWLLLGRRKKYEAGSGEHRLWLSSGGSAGHGGLWALDIDEGVTGGDFEGRRWDRRVTPATEARQTEAEQAKAKRHQKKAQQNHDDDDAILQAIDRLVSGERTPPTRKAIGAETGLSRDRTDRGIDRLILAEVLEERPVTVLIGQGGKRPEKGFFRVVEE